MQCPVCEAETKPRAENPNAPFCSKRCRLLDLGKWFDGSYAIPVESPLHEVGEDWSEGGDLT